MADKLLGDNRHLAVLAFGRADDLPSDLGRFGRHSAVDLAVEQLDDLRTPLAEPVVTGCHSLAIGKQKRIRQMGIGIRLGLVVIGGIGRIAIVAVGAAAHFLDAQKVLEPLVILLARELDRWRRARRCICRRRRLRGLARNGLGLYCHLALTKQPLGEEIQIVFPDGFMSCPPGSTCQMCGTFFSASTS